MIKKASLVFLILCLSIGFSKAQWKIHPYVGVYFTGDGAMEFVGPSILVGTDKFLKNNTLVSIYAHYFRAKFQDDTYMTFTVAALLQKNLGHRKLFFMALGVAVQRAKETSPYYYDTINRLLFLGAFRIGHQFHISKEVFHAEICATGPYITRNGMEILTLPAIGIRYSF